MGNPTEKKRETSVYTVGHSNLSVEAFLDLLHRHGIALVVDVRSDPYSRHVPHFNKRDLEAAVVAAGFRYRYAGSVLGGKPKDEGLHGIRGIPDYDRIAAQPEFRRALEHLCELAQEERVVVVCSEADPMQCHREKLLGRELRARGIAVHHILSDGSIAAPPAQAVLL